jgi:CcmD family protein
MNLKFVKQTVRFLVLLLLTMVPFSGFGQDPEMADVMRSNGKIYVVVAVAMIVLTGILVYLVSIDRKVSALEKKISDKKTS